MTLPFSAHLPGFLDRESTGLTSRLLFIPGHAQELLLCDHLYWSLPPRALRTARPKRCASFRGRLNIPTGVHFLNPHDALQGVLLASTPFFVA
jgi:hypothetical protein